MRSALGVLLFCILVVLQSAAHAATHDFHLSGLGSWKVHDLNTTGTIPVDFKPILVRESSSPVEAVELNPGAYAVTIASGTLTILRDGAEVRQATGPTDFTLQVRARSSATFDRTTRSQFSISWWGTGIDSGTRGSAYVQIASNDPSFPSGYQWGGYIAPSPLLPGTIFAVEAKTHCGCGPNSWTGAEVWLNVQMEGQAATTDHLYTYCRDQWPRFCPYWDDDMLNKLFSVPGLPAPDLPGEAWLIE